MNNNRTESEHPIYHTLQDELLREIDLAYLTSVAAPHPGATETMQFIDATDYGSLSPLETIGTPAELDQDNERKLHLSSKAQLQHVISAEKSAIKYWAL